jgi:endoglucanase
MLARRPTVTALTLALLFSAGAAAAEPAPAPVRLNQLGFAPDTVKRAMIANPSASPLPWRVVDAGGRTVVSGQTRVFGPDRFSGESVHQIDFSGLRALGEGYRLIVAGAESRPFAISAKPFARLKRDALAFFYHQRSGVPIEARFVGDPRWARPAGHAPDKATCFDKTDETGLTWPGCAYTLDATGGWYDAGDHGKYVVNGGISVWTLLNAYERAALRGTAAAFGDRTQPIPEAGNGVNDLLDEARFGLEFLLRMQAPEGARAFVPVGPHGRGATPELVEIDASGMAHHKLADERWTAIPTAPHEAKERRYLYPPSTAATLNLAATAAQAARIWREIDPAFAARALQAAERAFAAAERNPEVYAWNGFTGSGGYGDESVGDEFYWAAAELYATTGEAGYLAAAKRSPMWLKGPADGAGDIAWPSVGTLGTITLAIAPSRLSDADRATARAALVRAADAHLADRETVGYAVPYAPEGYPWGSTSSILNRAIVLALAYEFTGDAKHRDGVVDGMDFVLGRNPLDRSFVSGFGARPMRNPHHRFWAAQKDPNYPPPPPGALSGGPNDTNMSDPIAAELKGECAPQTCWADHIDSYAMNEVAVNWNAPLVWVAAWLDER